MGVGLAFIGAGFGTGAAGTAAAFAVAGAAGGAAGDFASQTVAQGVGWQRHGYNWSQVAGAAIGGAVGGGIGGSVMTAEVGEAGLQYSLSCGASWVTQLGTHTVGGVAGGLAGDATTQGLGLLTGDRKEFDPAELAFAGVQGGLSGVQSWGIDAAIAGFQSNCFAAGTPLLTPDGDKAIERFREGDLVLSRSEFDPEGPLEAKAVEEVFVRTGPTLELRVGGRAIRTTGDRHRIHADHQTCLISRALPSVGSIMKRVIVLGMAHLH